jgi:hypothetical protein
MSKMVRLQLVIDVEYDLHDTPQKDLECLLNDIPQRIAGEGLFTGNTSAEVEMWKAHVEEVPIDEKEFES